MSFKERATWFGRFPRTRNLSKGERISMGIQFDLSENGSLIKQNVYARVISYDTVLEEVERPDGATFVRIIDREDIKRGELGKNVSIFGTTREIIWKPS